MLAVSKVRNYRICFFPFLVRGCSFGVGVSGFGRWCLGRPSFFFGVCFWCRVLKSHFCSLSQRYETISIFVSCFSRVLFCSFGVGVSGLGWWCLGWPDFFVGVCFWCRVLKSHFCSLSRRYETIAFFFSAFLARGCSFGVGVSGLGWWCLGWPYSLSPGLQWLSGPGLQWPVGPGLQWF